MLPIQIANGSVAKAIELSEKAEIFTKINDIFSNLESANIIDVINSKEEIFKDKEDAGNIIEYISLIFFENINKGKYAECIELAQNTKDRLRKNNNFDMTIDRFLIKTWEILN